VLLQATGYTATSGGESTWSWSLARRGAVSALFTAAALSLSAVRSATVESAVRCGLVRALEDVFGGVTRQLSVDAVLQLALLRYVLPLLLLLVQ
jgi:hypothetical protein